MGDPPMERCRDEWHVGHEISTARGEKRCGEHCPTCDGQCDSRLLCIAPPPAAPDREGEQLHRQPYAMPITPNRMRMIESVARRIVERYAECDECDWPASSQRSYDLDWVIVDLLAALRSAPTADTERLDWLEGREWLSWSWAAAPTANPKNEARARIDAARREEGA